MHRIPCARGLDIWMSCTTRIREGRSSSSVNLSRRHPNVSRSRANCRLLSHQQPSRAQTPHRCTENHATYHLEHIESLPSTKKPHWRPITENHTHEGSNKTRPIDTDIHAHTNTAYKSGICRSLCSGVRRSAYDTPSLKGHVVQTLLMKDRHRRDGCHRFVTFFFHGHSLHCEKAEFMSDIF
jgi:hypothetical protein